MLSLKCINTIASCAFNRFCCNEVVDKENLPFENMVKLTMINLSKLVESTKSKFKTMEF